MGERDPWATRDSRAEMDPQVRSSWASMTGKASESLYRIDEEGNIADSKACQGDEDECQELDANSKRLSVMLTKQTPPTVDLPLPASTPSNLLFRVRMVVQLALPGNNCLLCMSSAIPAFWALKSGNSEPSKARFDPCPQLSLRLLFMQDMQAINI